MNQELRFGIGILEYLPWKKEVERWQFIEALGFDSVRVGDHFVNWMQPEAPWYEAWTLLAALASQTTRIRIGPMVTPIAFRNPAILARQALTVDHISNGRLELGLGAGAPGKRDCSYSMMGIEDWAPPERVARFREVVEIVDRCLRNRVTTYQGRYYQLKDTTLYPPPVQQPRPPITIAALGPSMLKIAARYADTWNSHGGIQNESLDTKLRITRQRNELINEYCVKIGRDPQTLRRSVLVFGTEGQTAFDSEEAFQKVVRCYQDVGITEFIFFYPDTDERISMMKRIAEGVIPKLRATGTHTSNF